MDRRRSGELAAGRKDGLFALHVVARGMDAEIDGVLVAETPTGPVAIVTLAVDGEVAAADTGAADTGAAGDDAAELDTGGSDLDAEGTEPTRDPDEDDNEDDGGERDQEVDEYVLPIFIGFEEAVSIVRGLEAEDIGRPLTHDLLLDIVEELGGRVDRVVVSDLQDGTYVADLHVDSPRESLVIDARPSDSLALAARTNAPIEVVPTVFEQGREPASKYADLEDLREVLEP